MLLVVSCFKTQIMKKAFLAALITGLVAGAVLLYLTNRTPEEKTADDVEDAAEDAYDTMNEHIGKVEKATEQALGDL